MAYVVSNGHVTMTSRDHLIPHRPFTIGGSLEPSVCLTVSEIFNGECDATVDMALSDLWTKVKVTWPRKVKFVTPTCLECNISKTAGLFLVMCARLSWPHSAFQSTLNSSFLSYRNWHRSGMSFKSGSGSHDDEVVILRLSGTSLSRLYGASAVIVVNSATTRVDTARVYFYSETVCLSKGCVKASPGRATQRGRSAVVEPACLSAGWSTT